MTTRVPKLDGGLDAAEALALVAEWLNFDAASGRFFWKKKPNRRIKVGQRAGHKRDDGYWGVRLSGKKFMEHRLAFLVRYGRWPAEFLDHINGDQLDNRDENLREATHADNMRNRGGDRRSRGPMGVYRSSSRGWVARLGARYLGTFPSEQCAVAARREAAERAHGQFAAHLSRGHQ